MNARDVIESALKGTQMVLNAYLEDLSDDDLLRRPVPGANHIAWQLGHLITSEIGLVKADIPDAAYPDLPAGFAEQHNAEHAKSESADGYLAKQQYADLFNRVRQATIATVGKLSDDDLDRPSQGPLKQMCPRLGDLLILVSNHTLMHGGQFTVVRRLLGKPILF